MLKATTMFFIKRIKPSMMKLRAAVVLAFLMLLSMVPVAAGDLTGIYVAQTNGTVAFFNLTDQSGYLTGYYQVVAADQSSSDGVRRNNFSVSGSISGSRAVLTVGSSYHWTADVGWNGFTVGVPMNTGQISEVFYRRSSVSEVNRLVASITSSGNSAKYYSNAQAELADSETRLSNDVNTYRPRILDEIRKAKAAIAKAQQKLAIANQKLADRKAIAAQKHAEADAARQSARTNDEQVRANELQSDANLADSDVNLANSDVTLAGWDVNAAERDLQSAENDLRKMDARIAQLRGIISRDKGILHIP